MSGGRARTMQALSTWGRHRELLFLLVARNLKIRYKNSVLGFFWSLLGPVLMILVYAVFLRLIRVPIDLPVLVSGIVGWQVLATCLGDGLHAVVGNANLVTKSAFPRELLPLATVSANLVNFLLSSVVLFVYLLVAGVDFGPVVAYPAILATQFALCLGVGLTFSCLNVYFRDAEGEVYEYTIPDEATWLSFQEGERYVAAVIGPTKQVKAIEKKIGR